jgi:predicted aspartyl protease
MQKASYPFTGAPDWNIEEGPRVPIRVWTEGRQKSVKVYALVDTGASVCVFPGELAKHLDHNLKSPRAVIHKARTFHGRSVKTYCHTFYVEILGPDEETVIASNTMKVPCVQGCGDPLLGVRDCLTSFRVTVDYPQKRTLLHWKKSDTTN